MIPIIAARPDGLGTRLLTILYAKRFAEQMGATFAIHWPSLRDENYKNSEGLLKADQTGDLFAINHLFHDREPGTTPWLGEDAWAGKRNLFLHGKIGELQGKTPHEIVDICSSFDVMIYDLPEPVVLAGSSKEQETAVAKENWRKLNIVEDVRDAFVRLSADIDSEAGVAVHIRRGDILNMLSNADVSSLKARGITQIFQRYIPLNTVLRMIGTGFDGAPSIAICSEDAGVVAKVRDAFPEKRIVSSNGIFPQGGNKAALLDLIILSEARHLITPFQSYFSECAATVGRCQLHNAGLDIPNLVDELIAELDAVAPEDINVRKAIVYMTGYQNLWYDPDTPYRASLLISAREASSETVDQMMPP